MKKIALEYGAYSSIGRVRKENQDSVLIVPESRLYAIADGMGGLAHGRFASRRAVQKVAVHFKKKTPESLEQAVMEAHKSLVKHNDARRNIAARKFQKLLLDLDALGSDKAVPLTRSSKLMGTTLTTLHIEKGGVAHVVHIGDSRSYVLRQGKLQQLTTDHALEKQTNVLTQWIGSPDGIKPEVKTHTARDGDVFLLSTDGLHKQVNESEIRRVLAECAAEKISTDKATRKLVQMANAAGGNDNATAVVVRVKHVTA